MNYIFQFNIMFCFARSFSFKPYSSIRSLYMRSNGGVSKKHLENYSHEKDFCPIYSPRGPNQKIYVHYLNDPSVSILVSTGPAGTGKTLFACATAVQELMEQKIDKIVFTRPIVPIEEEVERVSGLLVSKIHPWTRPIFDILEEFYSLRNIDSMLHSGIIEISPLDFMRGRTFKRSFIIADEMQNSTSNQMLMLTTRLGEQSRMVINGDLKQSDRCSENNGLVDLIQKLDGYNKPLDNIKKIAMNHHDVQRSKTVSEILRIYGQDNSAPVISHSSYSVFSKYKPSS